MPLNLFINAAFGDILKVNYQLDPGLATRTDIVTLRLSGPQPASIFLEMVRQVLTNYGIIVTERNGIFSIRPSAALQQQQPDIIRSRSARDVPISLRPIFQFVELKHVRPATIQPMLGEAFGGRVRFSASATGNAILLLGLAEDIRAVLGAVEILDQPSMANRVSVRITPAYWTADRLVLKLIEVLRAEGYEASARLDQAGLIQLVPVESINGLIVFAPDQQTLNFVIQWAEELDKPSRFGGTSSIFYYPVKNTKAESLAPLLSIVTSVDSAPVAGAAPSGAVAAAPVVPGAPPTGPAGTGQASPRGTGTEGRIVVDAARNGIIFRGSAEEYSKVRALLESLDQPVREAFIEVTIAEVTLDDTTRLGVEWALRNAGLSESAIVRGGTLGGLGIGTGGISFTLLNDSGQTRAVINALSSNNQVNILSTPRLLAKSGSEARIQVGNEVPIITSQQTTSTTQQGNAAILQSVQYRNTGVILTIKPVVHAGNRVDLDVSQEVSEAATNTTSNISSPTISNRRISTSLSLRDGASVMLGGLMSETRNSGETGVPILKDVPGLGQLFRTNTMSTRKTELLVIITPYIIDGDEDSRAITNSFRSRFPTLPR